MKQKWLKQYKLSVTVRMFSDGVMASDLVLKQ